MTDALRTARLLLTVADAHALERAKPLTEALEELIGATYDFIGEGGLHGSACQQAKDRLQTAAQAGREAIKSLRSQTPAATAFLEAYGGNSQAEDGR